MRFVKDGRIEFDGADAMLNERMAGNFHRHGLVPGIEHPGETSPAGPAIPGWCAAASISLSPDAILHGPNQAATALVGIKKMLHEKGGRRLSVGAGDPHDLQFVGWMDDRTRRPYRPWLPAHREHGSRGDAQAGKAASETIATAPFSAACATNWAPSVPCCREARKKARRAKRAGNRSKAIRSACAGRRSTR